MGSCCFTQFDMRRLHFDIPCISGTAHRRDGLPATRRSRTPILLDKKSSAGPDEKIRIRNCRTQSRRLKSAVRSRLSVAQLERFS